MDKFVENLEEPKQGHEAFRRLWLIAKTNLEAGREMTVTLSRRVRSLEQNSAQWPILRAFAEKLKWPVNGELVYLTPEDWKDVMSAAFMRESVRIAAGVDGGVVMLGRRTSEMTDDIFSEWIEFLRATATQRKVAWDDSGKWIETYIRDQPTPHAKKES